MDNSDGFGPGTGAGMYRWMWAPDVVARCERVEARALEVFGSSVAAAMWLRRFDPAVSSPADHPGTIIDKVSVSDEAMAEALAELDRLAPITTPKPEPDWSRFRRNRRR